MSHLLVTMASFLLPTKSYTGFHVFVSKAIFYSSLYIGVGEKCFYTAEQGSAVWNMAMEMAAHAP